MKAMVFAAGRGERLRPLTETIPKALVPIAGRPMIEYSLLLLKHHGIREIIINLHHLGEQIESHLGTGEKLGLTITYAREEKLLDTGGGLFHARTLLDDGTFVVINCDVIIDLPLNEVINRHLRSRAIATLVLRKDPRADDFGPIEMSSDYRIRKFLAHASPENDPSQTLAKFMFTGVQVLEPAIFRSMEAEGSSAFSITRSTYPIMLTRGEPLIGFPFDGYWQDLGTPERIKEAEEGLSGGKIHLHYL